MTRFILTLCMVLCTIQTLKAQNKPVYHIKANSVLLKVTPDATAKTVKQLKKLDNITLLEEINDKAWVKVQFNDLKGYVLTKDITSGEAVVTYSNVRIGAVCKDGSSSRATGRGACSHHGGVRRWKYERKQSVTIIKNQ